MVSGYPFDRGPLVHEGDWVPRGLCPSAFLPSKLLVLTLSFLVGVWVGWLLCRWGWLAWCQAHCPVEAGLLGLGCVWLSVVPHWVIKHSSGFSFSSVHAKMLWEECGRPKAGIQNVSARHTLPCGAGCDCLGFFRRSGGRNLLRQGLSSS